MDNFGTKNSSLLKSYHYEKDIFDTFCSYDTDAVELPLNGIYSEFNRQCAGRSAWQYFE